jgi:potassium channel subfamily K, other eukaryote
LQILTCQQLIGITAGMHHYTPPIFPMQTYTQGFWYGVMAAVLYFTCFGLLIINMIGYFLGHYPQRFLLTDHQRTLIIQTMLFFIWMAGGAAVFSRIEQNANPEKANQWAFVDALYFCDVTILTIGFGDLYPIDNLGRGLVFPFSVGGIIMLGLVISSLHKFASELSEDNIVKKHIQKARSRTFERTVTESSELTREDDLRPKHITKELRKLKISAPYNPRKGDRRPSIYAPRTKKVHKSTIDRKSFMIPSVAKHTNVRELLNLRKSRLILLREERDRFNAMRKIQRSTARFKRWWALSMSILAFGILWCIGAVIFWRAEAEEQGITYFQSLYFCYVSLLTIGYGDLAPKSNAGRCFFVVWSLIAVPTMTILISDMSNTVIDSFKQSTFRFADFTVLPQQGVWRQFLDKHPKIMKWYKQKLEERRQRKRLQRGMSFPHASEADPPAIVADDDLETPGNANPPTIEALAKEAEKDASGPRDLDEGRLARRLATAIRNVAADLRLEHERHYSYEEWVELTRLIRFTSDDPENVLRAEEDTGMVEWDWIGENSPLMSAQSEPEFVLERLCESLSRYVRRAERRRRKTAPLMERGKFAANGRNGLSRGGLGLSSDESGSSGYQTPLVGTPLGAPVGAPLGRQSTWDDGARMWRRKVTKEELFGSKDEITGQDFERHTHSPEDASPGDEEHGKQLGRSVDELKNDGEVKGRYDGEEIAPIDDG